jgi:hypothetical protein
MPVLALRAVTASPSYNAFHEHVETVFNLAVLV